MSSTHQFCGRCGAANRLQSRFCVSCGEPLQDTTSISAATDQVTSSQTGQLAADALLEQRYRVVRLLGRGGMGAVYQAEDLRFGGALRAVKELGQSSLNLQQYKEATESLEREALILARLNHPNLPHIYDHFSEHSRWYLVMDYIEGETLENRLNRLPTHTCTLSETIQIALHLCHALHYLHTRPQPIIFRDLKPANIMLAADDNVYLIDFGIARFFKVGQSRDTVALGSPGYAAPEQYGRSQTTPRSDIYSLGATLYRMLSGYDPSSDPFQFPVLALPNVPGGDEVVALIMQMIEMKRDKRPDDAFVVQQRLLDIAQRFRIASMPQTPSQLPLPLIAPQPQPVQKPLVVQNPVQPAQPTVAFPMIGNTIVVDQAGNGNFSSICEALEHARASMRILVRPGYYHEQLVLDKPVEIIGDGSLAQIILANTDASCIMMQTDTATIRGLTIRGREQGTRQFTTIDIAVGQLLIKNCDISSMAQVCISSRNAEAEPLIQQCKIHDCRGDAMLFAAASKGVVENCELVGNKGSGIVIRGKADPRIALCQIYDGASNGIYIYDEGRGRIEDCDIHDHLWAAVVIEDDADPLLQHCAIFASQGSGIHIVNHARGTIVDCSIYDNVQAGVFIVERSDPLIQHSRIYGGRQGGVYVYGNGMGRIEDCDISHNAHTGITIGKEGTLSIQRCTIHENKGYGITVYGEASGRIEDCQVQNNWKGGWNLLPGNDVLRYRNN
jgi:serine/threonine protein kinase